MASNMVSILTLITNFLCMVVSLWFAIYLLARSPANPLTFRADVALLAVALYYYYAYTEMVRPDSETEILRSLALLIALIATHDLTHYLLYPAQRRKLYWAARGIVLGGVVAIILLFTLPSGPSCDPLYVCPTQPGILWMAIDIFKVLIFVAILFNLWLIKKSREWLQNGIFYTGVLLGISTLFYGVVGTVLHLGLPRFIPNLVMLASLSLLLYSVARNHDLVNQRVSPYDLPITLLAIGVIIGIYTLIAVRNGLTPMGTLFLAVLVIFTHSAYDFVRNFLERLFQRQEHQMRKELRRLGQDRSSDTALLHYLRRGLAILCHNLNAPYGLIALRNGNRYEVIVSLHSLPVGSKFSGVEIALKEDVQPTGILKGNSFWFVPAQAGQEEVAVIGIGQRKSKAPLSEEDFYWLEDIAEEIGWMIFSHRRNRLEAAAATAEPFVKEASEPEDILEGEELFSRLAYKPDPDLVRSIEEGFRNLNDYSKLGKSQLAAMLGIQAQDHIERGKQVQHKLVEILEKLRPPGEPPAEPLPREWYAYTILHEAYVKESLSREIMAKLYISEGTYFRLRRNALRGITRALLEMGVVA